MRYLLLIILLFISPDLTAQILPFDHYSVKDGLPSNWITAIYQDSFGYIWLGSDEGITKYDGITFQNFGLANGLPVNHVWSITESKKEKGTFLVGTHGGGLCKFTNGKFTQIKLGEGTSVNVVFSILEDKDGKIWCSTGEGLIQVVNDSIIVTGGFEKESVSFFGEDAENIFWTGFGENIYKISPESEEIKTYPTTLSRGDNFTCFLKDRNKNIWIGTASGEIFLFKEENNSLKKITSASVKGYLVNLSEDNSGNIWASTQENGVYIFSKKNKDIIAINYSSDNGLIEERISRCFVDRENNIWLGIYSKGLLKLSYKNIFIFSLKEPKAFTFIKNERLFLVSEGQLLEIWESSSGEWKKEIHNVDKGLVKGKPLLIAADSDDKIAVLYDTGICFYNVIYNGDIKSKLEFSKSFIQGKDFPHGIISSIRMDNSGYLWCCIGNKVAALNLKNGGTKIYTDKDSLPGIDVRIVLQDSEGNTWFGDFNDGLAYFKKTGNELKFQKKFSAYDGLPDNSIRSIFQRSNGEVWIGTRFGGIAVIREEKIVRTISVKDGLLSNAVWGFTEDSESRLWIATSLGINVIEPGSGNLSSINKIKGYYIGSIGILNNGTICALGRNELILYKPERNKAIYPPPVEILGLRVNGKDIEANPDLNLLYNENFVVVRYGGLSFKDEKNLMYRYRLIGLDSSWSEPSASRYVTYGSLYPGKYTFEVIAINSDSITSLLPASISLKISPPLWQQWWVIALGIIFIAAVIIGLERMRVRRLIKIERIRSTIATDLHDDIGAGLTHIGLLSEVLSRRHKSYFPSISNSKNHGNGIQDDFIQSIEQIGKTSRELSAAMSDVVWSINPKYDSLDSLLKRISFFAHEICKAKNIKLDFTYADNLNKIKMNPEVRRNLLLIIKEAINNSVKYSQTPTIEIKIEHVNTQLSISIRDFGIGFDTGLNSNGNGLINISSRAKKINGDCLIESSKEKGTLIKVTLQQ